MTFRAKPVVKRARRPSWETQDRRSLYLNIGFGLIVILAIVILAVAAGLTYYNDHLSSVGSVDGQSISKDEFSDRLQVDSWRLDEEIRRISNEVSAGHISQTTGASQQQTLDSSRQQLPATSLERLIDSKLQAKLAAEEGVTVTQQDVDARLTEEATTPEQRHAWVIEVAPTTDTGAIAPTDAQKADAKAKAEQALKDIQGGKAWEDVAKTVSTDASTAPQAGDMGWIQADDTQADEAFLKALFAAPVNTPTDVVEGADGIFRIGRSTEIAASAVDSAYQTKIVNDGVPIDHYRTVVEADVLHQKLQDKIVADLVAPGPQRRVSEIYIKEAVPPPAADSIKVRHILYSPNGDPTNASKVAQNDPAWARARSLATEAYAKLKANPSLFDSIARKESDEEASLGAAGTGGKLPYFDKTSTVDPAFLAAIMKPGLKPGDILPPVQSAFGWHVIQIMYGPNDIDHLNALKDQSDKGADFAALARDNSEGTTASIGGDLGWIAKGQLSQALTDAIFAAPVGKTSAVTTIGGDGSYLFKVFAEETRTPEGRQLTQLTSNAFSTWYNAKKQAVAITRDATIEATAQTTTQ
jgi:parvulin-like peptidyl-prolyl isomerase